VASHLCSIDPGPTQNIIGTVNFDSNIVAIITSTGNLLASDFLANTGVNYLNPGRQGFGVGDSVTSAGRGRFSSTPARAPRGTTFAY